MLEPNGFDMFIVDIKSFFKRYFLGIEEIYIEIYTKHSKFPNETIFIEHKIKDSIFDIPAFNEVYYNYMNGKYIHTKTIHESHNKMIMKFIETK